MNLLIMGANIYITLTILTILSTLCSLFYVIFTTLLDVRIIINPILQTRKLRHKRLSNLSEVIQLITVEVAPVFVLLIIMIHFYNKGSNDIEIVQ